MGATAAQAESPGSDLSDLPELTKPKKSPRKPKAASGTTASAPTVKSEIAEQVEAIVDNSPKKGKGKAVKRANTKVAKEENGEDEKPVKKPRVSKASIFPPADLDPSLHPTRKGRTPIFTLPELPAGVTRNGGILPSPVSTAQPMLLGAHTSIAGGPATALLKAGMLGANGLAMFVKSQRQWKSKDYEEEAVERFRALIKPKEEGGESIAV